MIMTWAHPYYLVGIAVIFIAILLQSIWRRSILRRQQSLGVSTKHLCESIHYPRVYTRRTLSWLGLILICAASAGPRWGNEEIERSDKGAFVVFALDCSRSMLATDHYPDRVTASHRKALDIVQTNPQHKIALLPFARIATLRTPFTIDHIAIESMIKDCTPDLFPPQLQGTAIGSAVSESCTLFKNHAGSSMAIIILSDGSDKNSDNITQAIKDAKEHGIRVYGLFFGDPEREVTLTIDGVERIMEADRSTLDLLAQETGGICVNATNDDTDVRALSEHIRKNVTQEDWQEKQRIMLVERYQWFLIPGICLLAIALMIPLQASRKIIIVEAEVL